MVKKSDQSQKATFDLQAHSRVLPSTLSHRVEQLESVGLIEIERIGRCAFISSAEMSFGFSLPDWRTEWHLAA